MGDVFKEQLVKKATNTVDTIKKTGVIAATVVLSAASLYIPLVNSVAPLVIVALLFGAYYLMSFLKQEYEYIYTNGSLDIDVIYAKSRRKRVFSGNVKEFEIMAHVDNKERLSDFRTAEMVLNYSSGVTKPNTYAFLANYKSKKVKIIIEPNEMMLQAFATAMTPRKLIK